MNKNEFFVIWRDPNFQGKNRDFDYLMERKKFIDNNNIEIFTCTSIENALKILLQKLKRDPYKKLILISNIGLDYSGKRLAEIVREILGFDLIVLFYSKNKNHLKIKGKDDIKSFPNCLYTESSGFYEKFISDYNREGLEELKLKIEERYDVKFKKFTEDILNYDKKIFNKIEENNHYIRHVFIYCKNKDKYLHMTNDAKVQQSNLKIAWDITVNIFDKTITLFSNGFYLKKGENKIFGYKFMEKCYYQIIDNIYYIFYFTDKNNKIKYLSMEDEKEEITVKSGKPGKNETFELMDTDDDEQLSNLSDKIEDLTISVTISSSSKFS